MPRMVLHREPVVVYVEAVQAHRSFVRGLEVADDDPVLADPSLAWLFEDTQSGDPVESIRIDVPLQEAVAEATTPKRRRTA